MSISLNNYKVTSLSIINRANLEGKHNMILKTHHEVAVFENDNCLSRCSISLLLAEESEEDQEKTFCVNMTMEGFFTCTDEDTQNTDMLSEKCFREILPLFRTHISTSMAAAGIPPVVIPLK